MTDECLARMKTHLTEADDAYERQKSHPSPDDCSSDRPAHGRLYCAAESPRLQPMRAAQSTLLLSRIPARVPLPSWSRAGRVHQALLRSPWALRLSGLS